MRTSRTTGATGSSSPSPRPRRSPRRRGSARGGGTSVWWATACSPCCSAWGATSSSSGGAPSKIKTQVFEGDVLYQRVSVGSVPDRSVYQPNPVDLSKRRSSIRHVSWGTRPRCDVTRGRFSTWLVTADHAHLEYIQQQTWALCGVCSKSQTTRDTTSEASHKSGPHKPLN